MKTRNLHLLGATAIALTSLAASAASATTVLMDSLTIYNARGEVKATVSAPDSGAPGIYFVTPNLRVDTSHFGLSSFLAASQAQYPKDAFGICDCAGAGGHHVALAFVSDGVGGSGVLHDYNVTRDLMPKLREQGWTAVFSSYSAATVPEPSAWALMLVGFGGLGVVTRRRRVTRSLTAA